MLHSFNFYRNETTILRAGLELLYRKVVAEHQGDEAFLVKQLEAKLVNIQGNTKFLLNSDEVGRAYSGLSLLEYSGIPDKMHLEGQEIYTKNQKQASTPSAPPSNQKFHDWGYEPRQSFRLLQDRLRDELSVSVQPTYARSN